MTTDSITSPSTGWLTWLCLERFGLVTQGSRPENSISTSLGWVFQRMGSAETLSLRAVMVPGGLVAERLVAGEADLAIHQISEILRVADVERVD